MANDLANAMWPPRPPSASAQADPAGADQAIWQFWWGWLTPSQSALNAWTQTQSAMFELWQDGITRSMPSTQWPRADGNPMEMWQAAASWTLHLQTEWLRMLEGMLGHDWAAETHASFDEALEPGIQDQPVQELHPQ